MVGDVDGDGTAEGPYAEALEIATLLYEEIVTYASGNNPTTAFIAYDPSDSPYWAVDADEDGVADRNVDGELVAYNTWTPRLLKATYNYQYYRKEPGAFAHNGTYLLQLLCDSLEDLGNDVCGANRPTP